MPVDWKAPEAFTRLLAAIVASQDLKLDYRKIASMYGEGATYDSIESRFRIIKREAAVLREEVESGTRPEAPVRGAGPKRSPSKKKSAEEPGKTISGRVTKANGPRKRAAAKAQTNDHVLKEESGNEQVDQARKSFKGI